MIKLLIFIIFFYLLLISTIGYGLFFQNIIFKSEKINSNQEFIYVGFYGLFLLTLISLSTSIFFPHNFIHNLIIHSFGVVCFILIKYKDQKNYLKNIFIISLFVISALFISKTHDDFSYYHLPFTKYLTEQKVIFGMGYLLHGYKLLSSLFYLNSIFYLPIIDYFSFHYSLLYFLIFFNYFLIKEIFFKHNNDLIKFLYIFAFIYFNLSFNRLAEYGTDKVGQLLIVILIIKLLKITCYDNNKNISKEIFFLIPLLGLCISLKTYFLTYLALALSLILIDIRIKNIFKAIVISKASFIFWLMLSVNFFHHFISTGCIISPISFTCFGDHLSWAYNAESYEKLSEWLEQWAKAGAGPNFKVEDSTYYIKGFNWIPRWFDTYFLGKFTDQLLILTLIFLILMLTIKNFRSKKKIKFINRKILFFYTLILFIFFIWFFNHPSLRYGGYSIVFITIAIPLGLIFNGIISKDMFKKRFKLLLILVVLIFNYKNFERLNYEFKRDDVYKFNNFPFFAISEKKYIFEKTSEGLTIYKTNGHCWATPSPCTQNVGTFGYKVTKKNGYYFFNK